MIWFRYDIIYLMYHSQTFANRIEPTKANNTLSNWWVSRFGSIYLQDVDLEEHKWQEHKSKMTLNKR
jgi:hypothetical protein